MNESRKLDDVLDDYLAAVNERDATARQELIARCVCSEFVFATGSGRFVGHAEFNKAIADVHELLPPDAVLIRCTPVEERHGALRFGWQFVDRATGHPYDDHPFAAYLRGMDFARVGKDGLLQEVTVFYEAGLALD